MRFNVLIADNSLKDFKDFNQFIKNKLEDINISFSSGGEEILFNVENNNLILLSSSIDNYSEIIEKCKDLGIYVILLANELPSSSSLLSNMDILIKPCYYLS